MAETKSILNGGVMGSVRTFIAAVALILTVSGIVAASGALNQRVNTVEKSTQENAEEVKRLDDKKADKRELDDIHKQLDRIEAKIDSRR